MATNRVRWWSLALLTLGVLALGLPLPRAGALSNGLAARLVLGHATFTVDGAVTAKRLVSPSSVAVDPTTGAVFVADTRNNRVLRFASQSALANGAPADGVLGQTGFTSAAWLDGAWGMRPQSLAVDGSGRLWVADTLRNRVLRFDNAASKPNGAPADGVLGQPDFSGSYSATTAEGMSFPADVALDGSGRLWVADSRNYRVLRFDSAASKPNGAAADGMLGVLSIDTSAASVGIPMGLAVDGSGRLWVADKFSNRVLRFDNAASKPNDAPADGVLGQPDFTRSSPALSAQGMNAPLDVALEVSGRLWVVDGENHRVLRFDDAASKPNGAPADGVLGQPDFASRTPATSAQGVHDPRGLAVAVDGRLWVVDGENHRVLRFDAAASKLNGAAADGVLGNTNFTSTRWVSAEDLFGPYGIAVDPTTGKVFVADTLNSRVLRFAPHASLSNGAAAEAVLGQPDFTSNTHTLSARGMAYPTGVTVDKSGRLWVADESHNRVLRFDNAASKPNGAPADAVLGQPDFTTSTRATTAQGMMRPSGVAVDESGRLWVADSFNNRVLRFDGAASKPNGAAADGVLGQPDFAGLDTATSAQGMTYPTGVAVDGGGRLWVADQFNNRVLRFDNAASKPNGAPADGVLGQPDFTGNTFATGAQRMSGPIGVAVGASGRLWVADTGNNRVLRFDSAASKPNGAAADGVLGQPDLTSRTAATNAHGLCYPSGVVEDGSGWLWVTEECNHRALGFDLYKPPLRPWVYLPIVRQDRR